MLKWAVCVVVGFQSSDVCGGVSVSSVDCQAACMLLQKAPSHLTLSCCFLEFVTDFEFTGCRH